MKKIRPSSAAGKFYTDNKEALLSQLKKFEQTYSKVCDYNARAIIVPHAGYLYSGQLANNGFEYLDKNIKNVFIIAPPHFVPVKNVAISDFDAWSTPLGEIELNQEINQDLVKRFSCEFEDDAFEQEHSVEVQVPFVQKYLPNVKIVPILVGKNYEKVSRIINHYWDNPENAFVISSDLSHFNKSDDAKKIDSITAEMIEQKSIEKFEYNQACGAIGICSLVDFAQNRNFSLIRVGLFNSGDVTGDKASVVGYGTWVLYEGEKEGFLKRYFSEFIVDICKKSILSGLNNERMPEIKNLPEVFNQLGACFVTLEKNNDLRGCIGSIVAHQPLIDDLVKNAQNSAFSDPRFQPLRKDEFKDLSISISLLTTPQQMKFEDEDDLLEQIRPFVDGIIIKDGANQAVYLPSVWEQIPEKRMFLNSLKVKAGMAANHFSSTFETYRYTTEYIKSEEL